jgi:acetylornithine aminotransferase/acetylornithine/N-succinyldiaminopimelate aminotransferase
MVWPGPSLFHEQWRGGNRGRAKLARAFAHKQADGFGPAKPRILALHNSFHGRTFGALAVTSTPKYRKPFAPLMPAVEFVRLNDVADLEKKFTPRVCAIILEPVQGEGGITSVSEGFYRRARQLCNRFSAALIADEIQCGLGRTGRYFAYQKFGKRPDIAVVAKPLAGGLPLGAILAREKFAASFSPGLHGTTFGGGPLACATALEFLNTVDEEELLENICLRSKELRTGLEELAARFHFVREVRGEGLMLGLALDIDGNPYVQHALEHGLMINCTQDKVLRFLPPFIIGRRHVLDFLDRISRVLAETPRPVFQRD